MSWRCTLDSHGDAMLRSAGCSASGRRGMSMIRLASDARITAAIALSHPGIPSRSNKPRPTPRG
jgi:hypothetical protein